MTALRLSMGIVAALGGISGIAYAGYSLEARGAVYTTTAALPAGSEPTATATGRNVSLSWGPAQISGAIRASNYLVTRYSADGGAGIQAGARCAGEVSALECREEGLQPGNWRYTVTPLLRAWRGRESERSLAVNVGAPQISLPATTTAGQAALRGRIAGFLTGETVAIRMDSASGPVVASTIAPNPVGDAGDASVTFSLPSGTTRGARTVFAVGSRGSLARANLSITG